MRYLILLALLPLAACARPEAVAPPPEPGDPPGPFNVIVFIGDGTGVPQWSAAKLGSSDLAIERFPVVGLVDTRASNTRVTDSAAGATAFSAGIRTYNGAIAVGPDSTPVRTVLELAESQGMATGLVATSTITHATPAAFAAHVPSRNMHWEIAEQLAESGTEVLMGGGFRYFAPTERPDSQNLVTRLEEAGALVRTQAQLLALDPDTLRVLYGLFADNNPGPAIGREPSLPMMTDAALQVLENDEQGFFLMVEGSQIDWRAHDNAPLRELIAEVLDFDMAIRQGLLFQERHPNTLILVVADHETGGLALHVDSMGVFRAHYTTQGHSAEMIPLFASGPGASLFGGVIDNDRVGRLLLQLVEEGGAEHGTRTITSSNRARWNRLSH